MKKKICAVVLLLIFLLFTICMLSKTVPKESTTYQIKAYLKGNCVNGDKIIKDTNNKYWEIPNCDIYAIDTLLLEIDDGGTINNLDDDSIIRIWREVKLEK